MILFIFWFRVLIFKLLFLLNKLRVVLFLKNGLIILKIVFFILFVVGWVEYFGIVFNVWFLYKFVIIFIFIIILFLFFFIIIFIYIFEINYKK